MKILAYNSENFWQQLEEHLSLRDEETSSKIDTDVKSIIGLLWLKRTKSDN